MKMNSDSLKIKANNLITTINQSVGDPKATVVVFLQSFYQETIEEVAQDMLAKSNKASMKEDGRLAHFYTSQAHEVRGMKGNILR